MIKGATISKCGLYRYQLWRIWNDIAPYMNFIGLNPSTADAETDDPTIRRCMRFAKSWGYGGIYMTNLFAWRATEPMHMKRATHPIGEKNNFYLHSVANYWVDKTVVCWGNHGAHIGRDKEVLQLLKTDNLWCFGITKNQQPKHPLYLKADTKLIQMVVT